MSALDNIIEQMREAIRGEADGTTIPVPVEDIRALIAEHERVLAERAAPQEWEYGSALRSTSGVIWDATPEASLEEAEEAVQLAETSADDYAPDECIVVRRTGAVLASDWEPLPEDTNQTDDRSER